MNATTEGNVSYQQESQWCDDCKKTTVNVRALRMAIGKEWVSDWTCINEVAGKPHLISRLDRQGVSHV